MQLGFGSAIILSTLLDIVAIEVKSVKGSTASKVCSFVYICISVHAFNELMDKLSLLRVCVQTNEHTHTHENIHAQLYVCALHIFTASVSGNECVCMLRGWRWLNGFLLRFSRRNWS